jgi:hypothetical protein
VASALTVDPGLIEFLRQLAPHGDRAPARRVRTAV